MSAVTALVVGSGRTPAPGASHVVAVASPEEITAAARSATTDLLWILDAGAVAAASTLPALLEQADRPAASLPVDAAGRPIERLIGPFASAEDAAMLDDIVRRRVALRHTPLVSLLVERTLVAATAPPNRAAFGRYAGSEWTARLFAARPGVLVPASRVQAPEPGPANPLTAARTVRAGAWTRRDLLRELRRSLAA